MSEPTLSIVIALISGRLEDLERCLGSLTDQENSPDMEMIVPFDPPCEHVLELRERWPQVIFKRVDMDTAAARSGAGREHHDTLRTAGIRTARGEIVALTEDHAQVSPTWCSDMVRLLQDNPEVGALGGAVEFGGDTLLQKAVYYCDFGRYQNPLADGPAFFVSDSNVAYRREALDAVSDAWAEDYHETLVHEALKHRGLKLWLTSESSVKQVRLGLSWGNALNERNVWGRSYAGTRAGSVPGSRRTIYAMLSCVLPLLLTARIARGACLKKRGPGEMLAILPPVFVLQCAWAWGEFVGYVTGKPERL